MGEQPAAIAVTAQRNMQTHISDNPYPGRGVAVGRAATGGYLFVYWIMGRSPHSQNRRFVAEGGNLRTEPVDASKVEDPSLIIYDAMLELPGVQLVSNGDQTRTAFDVIKRGGRFSQAMAQREREPDAPNYTPRISAMLDFRGEAEPQLCLSLLKANPFDPAQTDRVLYTPTLPPAGYGVALTTYMSDGSPLPSYTGDPLCLPMAGTPAEILSTYYGALDRNNRVSAAVKHMDDAGRCTELLVENRFA